MYKFLYFIILVLITTTLANKAKVFQNYYDGIPDQCTSKAVTSTPFTKIGEHYYYLELKTTINWYAAAHECKKLGANLASIETAEEMKAIADHMTKLKNYDHFWIWLGGNDLEKSGTFQWIGTGENFDYTKWTAGQPDNIGQERCVHIWKKDGAWGFNNVHCTDVVLVYLCEANDPRTVTTTIW